MPSTFLLWVVQPHTSFQSVCEHKVNYFLDHPEPRETVQRCLLMYIKTFNFILKCLDAPNLSTSFEHSSTFKIHEPVFPH